MQIKFTKRDDEVIREVANGILKACVEIGGRAENYAKDGCPVDTGRLRNSINWATSETSGGGHGADGQAHCKADEGTVAIGTNVEYAEEQEFNENYNHTVGGPHYLRNAITEHDDEYRNVFEKYLEGIE